MRFDFTLKYNCQHHHVFLFVINNHIFKIRVWGPNTEMKINTCKQTVRMNSLTLDIMYNFAGDISQDPYIQFMSIQHLQTWQAHWKDSIQMITYGWKWSLWIYYVSILKSKSKVPHQMLICRIFKDNMTNGFLLR